MESATVRSTKVMEMDILFEPEWKNFSHQVKRTPIMKPSASERTTSSKGLTITETMLTEPLFIALATP